LARWVAAVVKDGSEQGLVSTLLDDHAIEAYCPLHKRWRKLPKHITRKTGKTRELITDALLTGYLFVKVETSGHLATVFGLKDVFGFVSTSAGPCFARASDIEALREIERSGIHDERRKTKAERIKALELGSETKVEVAPKSTLDAMKEKLGSMVLVDLKGKTAKLVSGPLSGYTGTIERVDGDTTTLRVGSIAMTASLSSLELA